MKFNLMDWTTFATSENSMDQTIEHSKRADLAEDAL